MMTALRDRYWKEKSKELQRQGMIGTVMKVWINNNRSPQRAFLPSQDSRKGVRPIRQRPARSSPDNHPDSDAAGYYDNDVAKRSQCRGGTFDVELQRAVHAQLTTASLNEQSSIWRDRFFAGLTTEQGTYVALGLDFSMCISASSRL
jgi:hypothetical protein